jgi:Domain of unknown function (DUF4397)
MKKLFPLLALAVVTAGGLVGACTVTTNNSTGDDGGATGDDSTTGGDDGATDTGVAAETSTSAEAGEAGEAGMEAEAEAAPPPQTNIRIANWSPDTPAGGFDFCLAPHGTTTWTGPILGGELADGGPTEAGAEGGTDAEAGMVATGGLLFPTVTSYLGLAPGQYDMQIVTAGSTSCATGVVPSSTNLPALSANAYTTLAMVGDVSKAGSDPGLTVTAFADDSTPSSGALLRFINVAPDLAAVDVGEGTLAASNFQALFAGVQFGHAGAAATDAGTVDSNSFLALGALSAVQLSAHTSTGGTSDTATASNVTVAAGAIATLALVNGKNGGPAPQFLLCVDSATTAGPLAQCSIVSP